MIYKIAVIDDYLNITKDLINWSEIPNTKVDFYTDKKVVETRQMITDGVIHSERYAEDAAINWVEGVIE